MTIIDFHFSTFIISFIIISIIFTIVHRRKMRKRTSNDIYYYMMIFYILALIKIVILPIYIGTDSFFKNYHSNIFQLIPFSTILKTIKYGNHIQIIGNIIILIPMPILMQKVQDKVFGKKNILFIVVACSLAIECMQLIICLLTQNPSRVFDVDDLILNILGGVFVVIFNKLILNILDKIAYFINRIIFIDSAKGK